MAADPDFTRSDADSRYELRVDGELVGVCVYVDRVYQDHDDVRVLTHTEVDPQHEGEGLGSHLVEFALDDIRSSGLKVDPQCPMVAAYIEKHDRYADLVA